MSQCSQPVFKIPVINSPLLAIHSFAYASHPKNPGQYSLQDPYGESSPKSAAVCTNSAIPTLSLQITLCRSDGGLVDTKLLHIVIKVLNSPASQHIWQLK